MFPVPCQLLHQKVEDDREKSVTLSVTKLVMPSSYALSCRRFLVIFPTKITLNSYDRFTIAKSKHAERFLLLCRYLQRLIK